MSGRLHRLVQAVFDEWQARPERVRELLGRTAPTTPTSQRKPHG
jgi:hypothetical protein